MGSENSSGEGLEQWGNTEKPGEVSEAWRGRERGQEGGEAAVPRGRSRGEDHRAGLCNEHARRQLDLPLWLSSRCPDSSCGLGEMQTGATPQPPSSHHKGGDTATRCHPLQPVPYDEMNTGQWGHRG